MRMKRSYRQEINEGKEDIDQNYELHILSATREKCSVLDPEQYESSPTKMQNNCNITYTPFTGTHKEKQKGLNFENSDLLIHESKSTGKKRMMN